MRSSVWASASVVSYRFQLYHAKCSFGLWFQPVVATHWLNRSAGVSQLVQLNQQLGVRLVQITRLEHLAIKVNHLI